MRARGDMAIRQQQQQQRQQSFYNQIEVGLQLRADGLAGGELEKDPFIFSHASFGKHRLMRPCPLIKLSEELGSHHQTVIDRYDDDKTDYILFGTDSAVSTYTSEESLVFEPPERNRLCDAIHFKLFVKTRFSGVDAIDQEDAAYVERDNSAGHAQLRLANIMALAAKISSEREVGEGEGEDISFLMDDHFVDRIIVKDKTRELFFKELYWRTKGRLLEDIPEKTIQALMKKEKHAGHLRRLIDEEYANMAQAARRFTAKASVVYRVTIRGFRRALYEESIFGISGDNTVTPFLASEIAQMREKEESGSLLLEPVAYNTKDAWSKLSDAIEKFKDLYYYYFVPDRNGFCRYLPTNNKVVDLQLPCYDGEQGVCTLEGYFKNQEVYYRPFITNEERELTFKHYGFTDHSEEYFLLVLRSAMRQIGITEASFISAIEEHFSPENHSHFISPHLVRADNALARAGTLLALSSLYNVDYRLVPNTNQPLETRHNLNPGHNHTDMHEIHACPECCSKLLYRFLDNDSWDNNLSNNTSGCDDCDGGDNICSLCIRCIGVGRYDLQFNWSSPLLNAAKKLLAFTSIIDNGAIAINGNLEEGKKEERRKKKKEGEEGSDGPVTRRRELPLIGSTEDRECSIAGHCHGIYMPMTRYVRFSSKGNIEPEILNRMVQYCDSINEAFLIRDNHRLTLCMEPTGPVDPNILTPDEAFLVDRAGYDPVKYKDNLFYKKALGEWRFSRNIANHVERSFADEGEETTVEKEKELLISLIAVESLSYYSELSDRRRWISDFYNMIVHGTSIDTVHRFGDTLTQFAYCCNKTKRSGGEQSRRNISRAPMRRSPPSKNSLLSQQQQQQPDQHITYGVTYGDLLERRTPEEEESGDIALIYPFSGHGKFWKDEILPLEECIINQMPISRLGRYTAEQMQREIYDLFLSPKILHIDFDFDNLKSYQTEENLAEKTQFEKRLSEVDDPSNYRGLVRLYTRTWKLKHSKKTLERLLTIIRTLPCLIDFAFYVTRPIPVCKPIIIILCLIDVRKALQLDVTV